MPKKDLPFSQIVNGIVINSLTNYGQKHLKFYLFAVPRAGLEPAQPFLAKGF